jgi:hypothetical protein
LIPTELDTIQARPEKKKKKKKKCIYITFRGAAPCMHPTEITDSHSTLLIERYNIKLAQGLLKNV